MNDKASGAEVREEQSGKQVAVQRGGVTPFRGFEERFEQMERMMDRMFSGFSPGRWMRPFEREWPTWFEGPSFRAPAVDLIDRENEVLVRAELPGVSKDEISISLTADAITIQAQSRQEDVDEKGDYRRREIRSSSFSRSLSLPAAVDTEAAKAAFKDGVLEITLPKTPVATGRQVPID
ncbi:MAG: Hsp20/alpha crystallin family protein [Candidatus Accumulibacter sp.]|uniref:Hsp20/alpha crystallin family protein n=1 Tax=Accumulibacter sp. TaxID=2053492 RepID=UPI001A45166A|nr:Hsp20/alpha crystallin family protein [Accumulibacter sp.]MBL8392369.1 Hsp20/alpha crystallin family protein [Accumulibacter sp.]HRD89053.1 Hsp20/alpha crystallin family protein [Accumulibacter sp.]